MNGKIKLIDSNVLMGIFLGFILTANFSFAQNCDPEVIAKLPGTWEGPGKGSIENVSPANLVKEREMAAKIHEMVKKSYSPIGGEVSYSYVFGYNKYIGKNWLADPYEYSMYFLEYSCRFNVKTPPYYRPNVATGTTVYFSVNKIWSHEGRFNLNPAELPDDHYDGFLSIKEWPVKKDGYYFTLIQEEEKRYPEREYQYLITYDNKLPFIPFTKAEYLKLKIPNLRNQIEEARSSYKLTNPELDSKTIDESEYIQKLKEMLNSAIELQSTFSPEESSMPAIIDAGESKNEFRGFKTANDRNILHLVKPDPAYYNAKLPKWVPQFININIKINTEFQSHKDNIAAIEKAIDFSFLKSLLGDAKELNKEHTSISPPTKKIVSQPKKINK